MSGNRLVIDEKLVRDLVGKQFPQWKDLPVVSIVPSGWDNRSFRLGEEMVVRMPSAQCYAVQVEKEQEWLPRLAPHLPVLIPEPIAMGKAGEGYPWGWSVYRWLKGESAGVAQIGDMCGFAQELAVFLVSLREIDASGGPEAGEHNFYRGGELSVYEEETRRALDILRDKMDVETAIAIWEAGLETMWESEPVWVHGDVSVGNLLVREGRLSAVIDFGMLGVGDPACDLAIGWTFLKGKSRDVFRSELGLDDGTWARGRAWVLWKAVTIEAGIVGASEVEASCARRVIDEVVKDFEGEG